jgi:5'-nucleotidase (lipoprotein e(P4) family)
MATLEERRFELEAEIQRRQVAIAESGTKLTGISPSHATVAGAALALIGGVVGSAITAWSTQSIETGKSLSSLQIEQLKVEGNLRLEQSKQNAIDSLERKKFETALILEAIKTQSRADATRNLKFFVAAGFVSDDSGKIAALADEKLPSISGPTSLAADTLLSTLWIQRAVEYKGNSLAIYELARLRLDEALADKKWTAAPVEQKGNYQVLPPAIVLDIDETVLDSSAYQAWLMKSGQTFSPKTWNEFCAAQMSGAVPGALEFIKHAAAKGVAAFYVSNRGIETKKDTRENLHKLGFPVGGDVDALLMLNEKPGWGSQKSVRRAVIAENYRILLNIGNNFGHFDDRYRSNETDRLKAFEENKQRWGREWLVTANPAYGSFDTAPFGHDFKKAPDDQRKAKYDVLDSWVGPKQP